MYKMSDKVIKSYEKLDSGINHMMKNLSEMEMHSGNLSQKNRSNDSEQKKKKKQ